MRLSLCTLGICEDAANLCSPSCSNIRSFTPGLVLMWLGNVRCRIGQSDPHAGRTFESFAVDLADVADQLGIKTFFVVGVRYTSGHPLHCKRHRALQTWQLQVKEPAMQ